MAGEKPTSRREFLGGRAAARALLERMQALADRAAGTWSGETPPAVTPRRRAPSTVAHLHASRQSMACEFDIQYHAADGPVATSVAIGALDLIDQLESQLTVYRPTSEVMDVNRSAASRPVAVEPRLFALLELCAVLYDETGGAFDVTAGPLSRVWGFLVRQGRLPTGDEIKAARRLTGFDQVRLDIAARTVAFAQPGVEINFNAIGKGYALDRVAAHMAECGVDDYLCHGGRSSVLARGRDRGDDCGGWRIAVPHPFAPGRCVGEIVLRDAALGT
ncbi:MAG TPA: FAD:protein FMN transferase, partial [Lacipirellulaceae bacterium]|nr:FAD:protein FMN transferase [Lacipirellulaceae bacterium]